MCFEASNKNDFSPKLNYDVIKGRRYIIRVMCSVLIIEEYNKYTFSIVNKIK